MEQATLASLIPETKLKAVENALQTAFNTTTVESIALLTGGLSSALVYKIVVDGRPYVLRLVMDINPLTDPARQYACMNIAAAAGIAPPVRYVSVADALAMTDFIATTPLSTHFISSDDRLHEVVKTIKALHTTPLFPKLVNFLDGVDMFIQQFKALALLPGNATAEHFSYYTEIQKVYPRHDPDRVSSHNDLNPNNMLFDGKQLWLIDWEAAFQNDRYVDLAIAARPFVADEMQETFYLKAYFGGALDAYKRARFFLMQQVCHMYYAMIMLNFAATTKPLNVVVDDNMDTPRLQDFHALIGAGKVSLATYEGKLEYGKVLLNQALYHMKTPQFVAAINKMT
jgi:thiamine kinase-like enzyme